MAARAVMPTLEEEVAAVTQQRKTVSNCPCNFLSQISLSIPPYIIKHKITYQTH